MTELQRCDDEIRQVEVALRGGHADIEGLLLALVDWRTERRLVLAALENGNEQPADGYRGGGSDTTTPSLGYRRAGTLSWPRNSTRGWNVSVRESLGS